MDGTLIKEKIVLVVCWLIGFLFLIIGIYDFIFNDLSWLDLTSTIAVFLILVGTGLAPKIYFTPFKQIFSPAFKLQALVDPRIQQGVLSSGLILALVCMVWGWLL
ncbi:MULTISPECIES: hypothetical protein [Pseudoalteromonas]|uniref:hypothetical protein n=1 Tax=Pseudoalteromonas TaxID=53246 RepID=UPI00037048A4|nr:MULTISPECIES: hypothetical protein [Pseudoalteromonas]MCF6142892.1 hypothetical protein [Pseudoalteromonas mariniglutinosa NCIMB 1770]TMN67675.1 hypothetical protein CWB85_19190 [Pseudoalteromonas sp. S1727]